MIGLENVSIGLSLDPVVQAHVCLDLGMVWFPESTVNLNDVSMYESMLLIFRLKSS
jgi:hypothetical protein